MRKEKKNSLISMKKITLILLFITCKIGLAQSYELYNKDTINFVDATGKKQGKWIIFNRTKKLPQYPADAKVEEGKFTDSRKVGKWIEYYPNGNPKNRITFENGRPNGYAIMYHENGKISEEGMWKNNRWVGEYKMYYENGQVMQEFKFNATGKREGPQKYYYENGQVMIEGNWQEGKESGIVKEYYENGDIKAEKNFAGGTLDAATTKTYQPKKPLPKDPEEVKQAPPVTVSAAETVGTGQKSQGPLNGNHTLLNKNKQPSKVGYFENNKLIDGKVFFYSEDGILTRIALYKGGKYVGDTVEDK
jgi:antitoxin component YwqK of YwqJK toxin-antitoxin module